MKLAIVMITVVKLLNLHLKLVLSNGKKLAFCERNVEKGYTATYGNYIFGFKLIRVRFIQAENHIHSAGVCMHKLK